MWPFFTFHVGKYSLHGASGIQILQLKKWSKTNDVTLRDSWIPGFQGGYGGWAPEVRVGWFGLIWALEHGNWVFPRIGGKPPKWMVKIMENPETLLKWMIWGVKTHYFWKHPNGVSPHILKRKRMFQTPIIQALKLFFFNRLLR